MILRRHFIYASSGGSKDVTLTTWYGKVHSVHDDFVIAYANATANELLRLHIRRIWKNVTRISGRSNNKRLQGLVATNRTEVQLYDALVGPQMHLTSVLQGRLDVLRGHRQLEVGDGLRIMFCE
jgi:hypothetical protein